MKMKKKRHMHSKHSYSRAYVPRADLDFAEMSLGHLLSPLIFFKVKTILPTDDIL